MNSVHDLLAIIAERKNHSTSESYVAHLLAGGPSRLVGKLTEEAAELVQACAGTAEETRQARIHEAADLLFHTLALIGWANVSASEIEAELEKRRGISGLAEKQARGRMT